MPLALFSPLPRPVTLAGRPYLARPLRLRDLFALADIAAGEPPGLPEWDPADPACRRALRDAYDAAEAWPPPWSEALDTGEGAIYVLCACLRDEGLTAERAAGMLAGFDDSDRARLMAVAFGNDPAATAADAIDRAIGVAACGERGSWPRAVAQFWADHAGLSEAALLDVSLPMFRLARSGGERTVVDPDSPGEIQEMRARFWADRARRPG